MGINTDPLLYVKAINTVSNFVCTTRNHNCVDNIIGNGIRGTKGFQLYRFFCCSIAILFFNILLCPDNLNSFPVDFTATVIRA